MKLSTQWALVIIGVVIASSLFFNFDHPSVSDFLYQFGFALGVALVALIVGAFTRFKRPLLCAVVYALCYFVVLFGAFHSDGGIQDTGAPATQMPAQAAPVTAADNGTSPPVAEAPTLDDWRKAQAAQWNQDVAAFIAAHPDLNTAQNMQVMQAALNAQANPDLSNSGILELAYATAQKDARWVAAPTTAFTAADWNPVALAFEQTHPDLKLGDNLTIMQRALNSAYTGQPPSQLLQDAYAAAQQDYSWTKPTVVDPYASSSQNAPWNANYQQPQAAQPAAQPNPFDKFDAAAPPPTQPVRLSYLQTVMDDTLACRNNGGDITGCYVKESPKRCTQQAITFIANPNGPDDSGANRRAWALCVNSCEHASLTSKWFGDCHRG